MYSGYSIEAYSPSLNETHRRIDLTDQTLVTNQIYAQQLADAFASGYNENRKNHATDWVGKIVWQTVSA